MHDSVQAVQASLRNELVWKTLYQSATDNWLARMVDFLLYLSLMICLQV